MTESPSRLASTPLLRPNVWYRVVSVLLRPLCRLLFRLQVTGRGNVPMDGPVILAPVHRCNFDSVFVPAAAPRPVNFMAKREFFVNPTVAKVLDHLGAFPVHRGRLDTAATRHALAVLGDGGVLGIYPEGTRCSGPDVLELHDGASWLSARTGAPIVPVGIGGSERVQPRGARGVHLGKVRIVFGAPIPAPTARSRAALAEHAEVLRAGIQSAFDAAGGPGPV